MTQPKAVHLLVEQIEDGNLVRFACSSPGEYRPFYEWMWTRKPGDTTCGNCRRTSKFHLLYHEMHGDDTWEQWVASYRVVARWNAIGCYAVHVSAEPKPPPWHRDVVIRRVMHADGHGWVFIRDVNAT